MLYCVVNNCKCSCGIQDQGIYVLATSEAPKTQVVCCLNSFFCILVLSFLPHFLLAQAFNTPEVVLVRSSEGLGGMSRALHRLFLDRLLPRNWSDAEPPVLLNSWEAKYFHVNHHNIVDMAMQATIFRVLCFAFLLLSITWCDICNFCISRWRTLTFLFFHPHAGLQSGHQLDRAGRRLVRQASQRHLQSRRLGC